MAIEINNEQTIIEAWVEHELYDVADAEKKLMKAILQSAIEDMCRPGKPYREAISYFKGKNSNYLFSFSSICEQLDICPRKVLSMVGLS